MLHKSCAVISGTASGTKNSLMHVHDTMAVQMHIATKNNC